MCSTFILLFFTLLAILLVLYYLYIKHIKYSSNIIENETENETETQSKKYIVELPKSIQLINKTSELEQNLKDNNKSMIVNSFMICQGLASEALWKAGSNKDKYPILEEAVNFYTDQYDFWFNNQDNEIAVIQCLNNVREWKLKL